MNTMQWSIVTLTALSSATLGAWVAYWRGRAQVADLLARIDKLEKARQTTSEHAAQARRQVEQLQKDLAAQHKARAEARSSQRKRELDESLDPAYDKTVRIARPAADDAAPALPAHGFADTLPMT